MDNLITLLLAIFIITFIIYCRSIYLDRKKIAKRFYSIVLGSLSLIWMIGSLLFMSNIPENVFRDSSFFAIFMIMGQFLENIITLAINIGIFTSLFWAGFLVDKIIEKRLKNKLLNIQ